MVSMILELKTLELNQVTKPKLILMIEPEQFNQIQMLEIRTEKKDNKVQVEDAAHEQIH